MVTNAATAESENSRGTCGSMSARLVNTSLVIVAKQFNPTVFGQLWLVRNGLVNEADFRPGCVFSDVMANVRTPEFEMFVTPEQFQFSPLRETDQQELIQSKVGEIVRFLPHTPFTAIGLNFVWQIDPPNVADYCRRHFRVQNERLYNEFDCPDARLGAYLSKDVLGCRLKLDIKPAIVKEEAVNTREVMNKKEFLQFAYNFHLDLPLIDSVSMIDRMLSRWTEAKLLAEKISTAALDGDSP